MPGCPQERVLHAALTRSADLAALLLLWLPKTFTPDVRGQIQWAQEGLGALGGHYALPTLSIARALARRCADGERWCYDRAHGTQGGGRQSLHADLNHPNDGGHALFAAHVHALFAAAADAAAARLRAGAPPPRVAPLPPPLYPSNGALGSPGAASSAASSALALPGGATSPPAAGWEGGGLCVDVAEMAASARANEGWSVVTEVAASKIARLPALQARAGARAHAQCQPTTIKQMDPSAGWGVKQPKAHTQSSAAPRSRPCLLPHPRRPAVPAGARARARRQSRRARAQSGNWTCAAPTF